MVEPYERMVGLKVGPADVGLLDGFADKEFVGPNDGTMLALAVGAADGKDVTGIFDGAAVGAPVG